MKNIKWIIILCFLNLIIVAGIISWVVLRDNSAPVIDGPKEGVYKLDMTDEEILSGITAVDAEDGDVSDTLVVEKVIVNEKSQMASVICGAKDESGNIARKTFRRQAEIVNETEETTEDQKFHLEAGEAANDGDLETDNSDEDVEEAETEESSLEEQEEVVVGSDTEEDNEDTDNDAAENDEADENVEEPAVEEPEQKTEQKPTEQNKGSKPVLQFSKNEVKTKAGVTPAWVTVIGRLEDDTDNYEELLHTLTVKGEYKKDQTGTYRVNVVVRDKDGNESNAVPINIIVEG